MATHDVVVVGAGLAGLRAAQVLCRRGLDVVVLDAADRPGGRVATDVVDGFRCDRGFQVLNTSYPALRAAADLDALDLRAFTPAAAVRGADGAARLRRPAAAAGAGASDDRRPARAAARQGDAGGLDGPGPGRAARAGSRRTAAGRRPPTSPRPACADRCVDRVLRPFLSGVLGEAELTTSAAYVRLVWRAFALGTIAVPAAGMGALPAQLAAGLPDGVLRLGRRVDAVRSRGRAGGRRRARAAGGRRRDGPGDRGGRCCPGWPRPGCTR